MEEIVPNDCVKKAKRDGEKMKREQKIKFVEDWKEKNREMLDDHEVLDSSELHKFVVELFCQHLVKTECAITTDSLSGRCCPYEFW